MPKTERKSSQRRRRRSLQDRMEKAALRHAESLESGRLAEVFEELRSNHKANRREQLSAPPAGAAVATAEHASAPSGDQEAVEAQENAEGRVVDDFGVPDVSDYEPGDVEDDGAEAASEPLDYLAHMPLDERLAELDRLERERQVDGQDLESDTQEIDPQVRLAQLTAAANAGDAAALTELREMLDAFPAIWQYAGNLAELAEHTGIASIANDNSLLAESMKKHTAEMKRQLTRPNASLLEKMAVQRVTACWVACQNADLQAARADGDAKSSVYWSRRQEAMERRYTKALKSLELTQKLNRSQAPIPSKSGNEPGPDNQDLEQHRPTPEPAAPVCGSTHHRENGHATCGADDDLKRANGTSPAKVIPKSNGRRINRLHATLQARQLAN